jgi:hypothetical protein
MVRITYKNDILYGISEILTINIFIIDKAPCIYFVNEIYIYPNADF